MLRLKVPPLEYWDEAKEEFNYLDETVLELEHSLVSISKWEAKWHRPFLNNKEMSYQENLDYINCMSVNGDIPAKTLAQLSTENITEIQRYIENPMTATTFYEGGNTKRGRKEIVTAELIYYWMIALQIPMECQYWHLNRLLTLIRVCNIKNQPPKKRSKSEIMNRNRQLNKERRERLNTKG